MSNTLENDSSSSLSSHFENENDDKSTHKIVKKARIDLKSRTPEFDRAKSSTRHTCKPPTGFDPVAWKALTEEVRISFHLTDIEQKKKIQSFVPHDIFRKQLYVGARSPIRSILTRTQNRQNVS